MATAPDGTTFAVAANIGLARGTLWRIDTTMPALSTMVAQLENATGTSYMSISGLAFRGSTLFGLVGDGADANGLDNELVTINTSTGLVTAIGAAAFNDYAGNGIAFDSAGTLYATSYDTGVNQFARLNPSTGAIVTTTAQQLVSTSGGASVKSLMFVGSTLLGLEVERSAAGARLVSIDRVTATNTAVGLSTLPPKLAATTFAP